MNPRFSRGRTMNASRTGVDASVGWRLDRGGVEFRYLRLAYQFALISM